MKRVVLLPVFCGLALGGAGCGNLPDVTDVVDLRVLAVKCEPAGFLVDLDNPGAASQMDLTATITALVADPLAPGGMVEVSAVGCPDYIDTITAATGQGSKLCPPASATSQIPEPLGSELATTTIIPSDMPQAFPATATNDLEYNPQLTFGLRPDQVGAFFSPTSTGIAVLDDSISKNRDFGLSAIVNLSFDINGEHATAIKNVVYWPRLDATQQPNTNPTLAGILLYQHRNADTGDPEDLYADPNPTLSISAGDKLYVQPDYLPGPTYAGAADQNYLLRVNDTQTDTVSTQVIPRELIRFNFYTTVGSLDPPVQMSELNPVLSASTRLHTDAEYVLPKAEDVLRFGKVTIWIVTHDERAGSDWMSTTITVVP